MFIASISTKLSSDVQSADFNNEDGTITWNLSKMSGQTECIGEFRVSLVQSVNWSDVLIGSCSIIRLNVEIKEKQNTKNNVKVYY